MRRLMYLFAGASAPAITSIVFCFIEPFFSDHPVLFYISTTLGGLITGVFLVLMAYVVSFFGMNWTLTGQSRAGFSLWLLKEPMAASIVLGLVTVIRRAMVRAGNPYIAMVPISMVATILVT